MQPIDYKERAEKKAIEEAQRFLKDTVGKIKGKPLDTDKNEILRELLNGLKGVIIQ